jgi:hypothetical protein
VNDATASSLAAKTLSKADAVHVQGIAKEARAALDAAKLAAGSGDPATAEGRLLLATNILTTLQSYLRSRQ